MKNIILILGLITVNLLLNSCSSDKFNFEGCWLNNQSKNQIILIKKNGDSYLIEQNGKKYPAEMEGDFLVLNPDEKAVFDKENAHLIINGIEYYRMTGNEFVGKWASHRKQGLLDVNKNGEYFDIVWKSRTDLYQVKEYKLQFKDGKLITDEESYAKIEIKYNNPESIDIVVNDNPEFEPLKERLSPTSSTFIVSSASDFIGNYAFGEYSDIPRFEVIDNNGSFKFIQYYNHGLETNNISYRNGKMYSNQGVTLELADENTLIVDGMLFEGGTNFQVTKQSSKSDFFGAWVPEKEISTINFIKIFRKGKDEYQIFSSRNIPNDAPYNFQKVKPTGNGLESIGNEKIEIIKQSGKLKISWDKEDLNDVLFINSNWDLSRTTPNSNNQENSKSTSNISKDNDFYIINIAAVKIEADAKKQVEKLKSEGQQANYLWIPDYKSLSGAEFYSVYIGPYYSQLDCEKAVEEYRKNDSKAYALLVSQKNKRVEIRGIGKVKIIEPYHK